MPTVSALRVLPVNSRQTLAIQRAVICALRAASKTAVDKRIAMTALRANSKGILDRARARIALKDKCNHRVAPYPVTNV
jgi:hypothetical protein